VPVVEFDGSLQTRGVLGGFTPFPLFQPSSGLGESLRGLAAYMQPLGDFRQTKIISNRRSASTTMLLFQILAVLGAGALVLGCHPEGPPVPRPRKLKQSKPLQETLSGFARTLDDALAGKIKAGFDVHNISFSIGVTSYDQPRSDPLVWEYHHLSPSNVNGTKSIDRHSQYLIGSISKVITVC